MCACLHEEDEEKKKRTKTTNTKKIKIKNPVQTSTNVTRNPLASVLIWSPLSRLYRDCVDGGWDAEESQQPGDEQVLCKIIILR